MSGLVGLAQLIQAAINSPQCPVIVQVMDTQPPCFQSQGTRNEDVTMLDVPPVSDISDDSLSRLLPLVQDLLAKEPHTLTPDEVSLVGFLRAQLGLPQEEPDRNCPQRSDSLNDQSMCSPLSRHQTPPRQQPCGPAGSEPHGDTLAGDCPEESDGPASSTAFANVRHRPYPRLGASDETPRWVKKKASTRSMCKEIRHVQEKLAREAKTDDDDLRYARVEAKKMELLGQVRAQIEEAGGQWNEEAALAQLAADLQKTAEQLVREEDEASRRRTSYFTAAVEYVNSSYQKGLETQTDLVKGLRQKCTTVERLDKTIKKLRQELKKVKECRDKQYRGSREALVQELQLATDTKNHNVQLHGKLLAFLQAAMEQDEQDFYTAWGAFQAHFGLVPSLWPPGVPPPPETSPESPLPSQLSTQPSTPSSSTGTETSPPSPTASNSQSSETAATSPPEAPSSALPPALSPARFSYQFLPTRKPRNSMDRIRRYTEDWDLLKLGRLVEGNATFDQMPWPVFFDMDPDCLDKLTLESVREFVLHDAHLDGKKPQTVVEKELVRWHADKLQDGILRAFIPKDRDAIIEASKQITGFLIDIRKSVKGC